MRLVILHILLLEAMHNDNDNNDNKYIKDEPQPIFTHVNGCKRMCSLVVQNTYKSELSPMLVNKLDSKTDVIIFFHQKNNLCNKLNKINHYIKYKISRHRKL